MANDSDHSHEPKDLSPAGESSTQEGDGEEDEPSTTIPEELLAGVPKEHRQAIFRAFSSVTQFAAPVFNPIFQKVTSEHVSQIIGSIENDSIREHDSSKSLRRYQFAYFVLGAIVTVGLIIFFTVSDNRELIAPIVTGVTGFLGGLAVGHRFRS